MWTSALGLLTRHVAMQTANPHASDNPIVTFWLIAILPRHGEVVEKPAPLQPVHPKTSARPAGSSPHQGTSLGAPYGRGPEGQRVMRSARVRNAPEGLAKNAVRRP